MNRRQARRKLQSLIRASIDTRAGVTHYPGRISGCAVRTGGETWVVWALHTDPELAEMNDRDLDISVGGDGYYSGPGRGFCGGTLIRRTPLGVLVTANGGLDI